MSQLADLPMDVSKYIFSMTGLSTAIVSKSIKDAIMQDKHVYTSCVVRTIGSNTKAIEHAACHGKINVVKMLFSKFPELRNEECYDNVLFQAIDKNYIAIVEFILSFKFDILSWAPILCIHCDHFQIFKLIMTYDHLTYDRDILVKACEAGRIDMVQFLLDMPNTFFLADYNGRHLAAAARNSKIDMVTFLLERFPFVSKGYALIQAVEYGHLHIVEKLLEAPANPPFANHQNGRALLIAAALGHDSIVATLLNWSKNMPLANCRDGFTLVLAAIEGRYDTIKILLEWPNHPPRANCHDGEALCMAAKHGHASIVKLLLEWPKYPPNAQHQIRRALHLAREYEHNDIVAMMNAYLI